MSSSELVVYSCMIFVVRFSNEKVRCFITVYVAHTHHCKAITVLSLPTSRFSLSPFLCSGQRLCGDPEQRAAQQRRTTCRRSLQHHFLLCALQQRALVGCTLGAGAGHHRVPEQVLQLTQPLPDRLRSLLAMHED